MKTCPVCGETYSERIDFCFNEGAVLSLQPSALDAPVPRMAAAAAAVAAAAESPSLARGVGEGEAAAPVVTKGKGARPKKTPPPAAPEVPAEMPAAARDVDQDAVETQTEIPAVSAAVVDDAAAAPFGELPSDVGEEPERRAGALPWFLGAAAIPIALSILYVVMTTGGAPANRAPTPSLVEEAPLRVPATEPIAAAEVVDAEPVEEEPAVVEAEPAPEPEPEPAPEPVVAAAPAPRPVAKAPATPKPAATSLPGTVRERAEPIRPPLPAAPAPPRVTAPAPSTKASADGPSPWDASTVAEASVRVLSDPPGAVVRIDGRLRGKTPLDVRLEYGTHAVELALDGYVTLEKDIEVASDNPKFPYSLTPAVRRGNVYVIAAGWEGALLLVDGEAKGQIPVEVMLTEGGHIFEVRGAPGQQRTRKVVSLAPQGVTRLELTF